jgi:hypothetical protein
MSTRNALATARIKASLGKKTKLWTVVLEVWNRSYDHPDPARRNSIIRTVELVDLPATSTAHDVELRSIVDRYGVSSMGLWEPIDGIQSVGFDGYVEYDVGGACGPDLPNVFWSAITGIYDERCLADPACDAMRLQTLRATPSQVSVFEYLIGPVTFTFTLDTFTPTAGIQITHSLIGGNGGDPTRRMSSIPDEQFIIHFP